MSATSLQELLAGGPPSPEAIEAFLSGRSVPLVQGRRATFLYRGDARAVYLQHWIYGLESSQPFERVPGSELWTLEMDVPPRSRIEYKLVLERHDGNLQLIQDPLNPHLAHDPFGANSVLAGEGYERPEWTLEDGEARPGTIEPRRIRSHALGARREVAVYVPARFRRTRRYPLIVVHDGSDYLRFSSLKVVLDNMIHRLEIPPVVVALLDSRDRLVEYADDERHARFLAEELLPAMGERYPLVDRPDARGLVGASFGAVACLAAAWRHPGVFGRLLLQSGSFAFTDIGRGRRGPLFDRIVEFVNAFREAPGRPSEKVFLTCGTYESLIYENRSLVPILQGTGMALRYVEARDGHNWENWRDRLREGLSWLFPGPLWMVYE